MPKKIRWIGIPLLVGLVTVLSLVLACGGGGGQTSTPTPKNTPTPSVGSTPTKAPVETRVRTPVADGSQITINHKGNLGSHENYAFDPWKIELEAGKEYTLKLVGGVNIHTFTVPALNINVIVDSGQTHYLTLKVDNPGEYKLICIPHDHLGMVGRISVK